MRKLLAFLPLALVAAGCSGGDEDPNAVQKAADASAAMPKKPEDLPADMPPVARRQAEAAMAQSAAQREMMEKQAEGMKAARGGG